MLDSSVTLPKIVHLLSVSSMAEIYAYFFPSTCYAILLKAAFLCRKHVLSILSQTIFLWLV